MTNLRTEIVMAGKMSKDIAFSKDLLMQERRPTGQAMVTITKRSLKRQDRNHMIRPMEMKIEMP